MKKPPLICITMGDPAGIGPEIIAKVFDTGAMVPLCRPVIVGDAGVIKKIIGEMNLSITVSSIDALDQADPRPGSSSSARSRTGRTRSGCSSWGRSV